MISFTVWFHPQCTHGCLIVTCQTKLFSGHLAQPKFWTSIPPALNEIFQMLDSLFNFLAEHYRWR